MTLDKIKKSFIYIPALILLAPTILSCNKTDANTIYLRILNSEDYIYKKEDEEGDPDMTVQFENYYNEHVRKPGEKKVKVVYDTFDTMENMFNTLKTGKTKYDLVCASEYMVQKLASLNLIERLDKSKIDNYYKNYSEESGGCSPFIRNKLGNISAVAGKSKEEVGSLDDYALCYMWGTLGILYNPTYPMLTSRGLSQEQIISDMKCWDTLWNNNYKQSIAIKDSMRDTYAIGVMHSFKKELAEAQGSQARNTIFNYGGVKDQQAKEHIAIVEKDLLNLRSNVFGFEVDSGKQDIVTGKIGVDTAWSGDAVHSMNEGDEQKAAKLYYSIPTEGTNLWFDCWCMQTDANKDVANEFLNFISNPEKAIQNMDYIGYTSPLGGEKIFEYFKELYDNEEGEKEYNVSYFFKEESSVTPFKFKVTSDDYNRQIAAQFPEQSVNDKLMIMEDYGDNSDLIMKMWEEVKHESLPTWAIVLFSIEIALIAGGIITAVVIKTKNKRRRAKRKNATIKYVQ